MSFSTDFSESTDKYHAKITYNSKTGLFDGFIISARYNLIKPGKEIFNVLFKEFSLNAEECFFIDDSPANVTTANEIGMTAHCFSKHEISKLIDALHNADITF